MSSSPETERTLPSESVVSVGYQRASFIGSTLMYFSATGSNSKLSLIPWKSFLSRASFCAMP